MEAGGIVYRYESFRYGYTDEFDRPRGSSVEVELRIFHVVKRTPKGFWIDLGFGSRRFVRSQGTKRYAHETPELAMQSFIARKRRQLQILHAQIEHAEQALVRVGVPLNGVRKTDMLFQ